MPPRLALCALLAAALLLAPGCKPKLQESRTYTLNPGEAQYLDLPAVSRPQRVTVEFTSSAGEVTVYILKNAAGNDGLGDDPPGKDKTLDTKRGASGTVSADVSPDTATRVVVRDARQKTDVALTVTNRK